MGYTSPEARKAWKDKNPEKVAAHNRASYLRHRERRLADQKAYNERERDRIVERNRANYAADPDKYRNRSLKAKHGITRDEYEELLDSQNRHCAVCPSTEPGGRATMFHIDHDHDCCGPNRSCVKCRRGLLCSPCNVGIGMLQDSAELLRNAASYLEKFLLKGGD